MMGSAAFLVIYAAVSFGHLRDHRETGASPVMNLVFAYYPADHVRLNHGLYLGQSARRLDSSRRNAANKRAR